MPKRAADGSCWFCLSNPNLETHLLISIGKSIYMALGISNCTQSVIHFKPKGPLVDEHVILVPITGRYYLARSQLLAPCEHESINRRELSMNLTLS